jgi:ArsR family transcriptional regulator, arsenate/arsenite/antimonite-responsive transcriptional repressor / arsenate reductase (thioredoxin)
MDSARAAAAFAALSQETRVRLVRTLASAYPNGMSAGQLADALTVPSSTLSFHLSALERAELIQSMRRGRQLIYAIRFNGLRNVLSFVTETCCSGRPDLCDDIARLLPSDEQQDSAMSAAFNVLFLCTQNSARSIMAEAILQKIGRGRFNAYSAGSHPAKAPLPAVIRRLHSLGHDVGRLRSKSWHEFAQPDAPRLDFVITLCDAPQGARCPDFGALAVTGAWPLPDPSKFNGNPVERQVLLGELYHGIRRRLDNFCNLPFAKLDRMAAKARLDEIAGGAFVLT